MERGRIADSMGIFGLNFWQDLLLLHSAELVGILLNFSHSILAPFFYFCNDIFLSAYRDRDPTFLL